MTALERDKIFRLIEDELNRQDEKWGNQRQLSLDRWNTIMTEEVGEVAQAINDGDAANLVDELVQVAAVCVQWLGAL